MTKNKPERATEPVEKLHYPMIETTGTQTIEALETWTGSPETSPVDAALCRLRVLYHTDLNRVGMVSAPEVFEKANPWLMVGRHEKIFLDATGAKATLEDPTISRKQFLMRWIEEEALFEIEPIAKARLELNYLSLRAGEAPQAPQPITTRTRLPPGSCLSVGNRLLLGLERVSEHHDQRVGRQGLIGESERMWRLRESIREVASFSRPALVLGPTGSGKELVSRAIHDESPRREGPFVVANCAALPDNIIESLLFGHQKGAFTGASGDHQGFFRMADGGTLFLDEIGELPIELQPKLLRVIQDGEVRPVGSERSIALDVRLIAATNRTPEEEIEAGRLREDLYHRLATYLIYVPPLNDRRLDVPELFVAFLKRFREEAPQSNWLFQGGDGWKKTIPLGWFLELISLDWSGNVRQLENMAARVVQTNLTGPPFRSPPLPAVRSHDASPSLELAASPAQAAAPDVAAPARDKGAEEDDASEHFQRSCELLDLAQKTVRKLFDAAAIEALWQTFPSDAKPDEIEAKLHHAATERLLALLAANNYSQRRVSKHLGLSPSTLIKLMQRFGLPRPSDLALEQIEEVLAEVGEDLDAAAKKLRVSPRGLRRQLTLLHLKES